jgi:ACT domain-containing protein
MSRNQNTDKKALLTQLEKTPIVEAACKKVGLPRSTYYRWRKDDEEFAAKCDETIELSVGRINDLAESQLINAIKEQNMTAITFWLKHHHHGYRNRVEVDAHVETLRQELSPEQVEMVTNALRLAGIATPNEMEIDHVE